jgi:hypothetical protein
VHAQQKRIDGLPRKRQWGELQEGRHGGQGPLNKKKGLKLFESLFTIN